MMNEDNSFIEALIKQKENDQIEFIESYNPDQILQIICSLLNTNGGWVLVGYNGKRFTDFSDKIDDHLATLQSLIVEKIFPQPLIDVRIKTYNNYKLLLINVIKGSRQPYSFANKYYVRRGDNTHEASFDEISLLMRSSNENASTWEKLTAIDATIDDLVKDEVEITINEAEKFNRGKSLPKNDIGFLNYFQLVDMNLIKNGAIVLFAIDPLRFLPQCQIRITVMPDGKSGDHFTDSLLITDNLFTAFKRVQDYFIRTQAHISEFSSDKWDRTTRVMYPMKALDEAILNAMVHRDYADISGEITINIKRNSIEIINSGEIPPHIIKGKSNVIEHHSILRNPTIAHMFYLRGKIEKIGRGMGLIREEFLAHYLREPEWVSQNGYTTLTLYSQPKLPHNIRIEKFLKSRNIGESFTRDEYNAFFGKEITERTARLDLNNMLEGGYIVKQGSGPKTRYSKTSKTLPDITG